MDFETLGQLWPLQSGSTNEPTLTAGKQTTFQYNDVPDRCPGAPLAYYLPGTKVIFRGTAVQAGGEGASTLYTDLAYGLLFEKLSWIQTFFGSPVQGQNVTGAQWAAIEYISNGYRYEQQPREIASSTAGSYPFEVEIFVPFASCMLEGLQDQTMQLALLARSSQLQIVAGALALGTITLTGVTVTASAALLPAQELVLGTPIETVLSTPVAGSGSAVKITNFGTDSGINGIDPGGGVLSLLALTNALNMGGSFDAQNLTQLQFNWRGQQQTQDILGLLTMWRRLLPSFQNVQVLPNAGAANMMGGFPYVVANSVSNSPASNPNAELGNLICWPLVLPGRKVRLTSLQTADSDQTFNMTVTGGFDPGSSHQILGNYARSWQERMVQAWIGQVTAGDGGSLAAYVLGPNYTKAQPSRRAPAKHSLSNDQIRYLPWQLSL